MRKMSAARLASCRSSAGLSSPAAARRPSENVIDTPQMNRKNGKIQSVKVQPFHSA